MGEPERQVSFWHDSDLWSHPLSRLANTFPPDLGGAFLPATVPWRCARISARIGK
jgi:hypothetical protein